MKYVKYTAYLLVLIGALNWGLVGIFDFNLVSAIFGDMTIMSRIIYSMVGIAAVIATFTLHKCEADKKINNCEYGSCRF